jgi:hypothetical protein
MFRWIISNSHKQNGFETKVLTLVLIPNLHFIIVPQFPGCYGPDINPNIIIYFCLLHNQGERFKIISTIGQVLCVQLFMNGFIPSMLITILIFFRSMANLGFRESMFCHYVASVGCIIIPTSYLCFSLYNRNNSDSLFTN